MTAALEIRLIAYGLLALLLLGGSAWAGHKLTAMHYEALIARDKAAQDEALQSAQQRVIAAQQAQAAAENKAEKEYEDLKVTADATSRRLTDSVREYATLHSLIVSKPRGTTAGPDAAPQGTGRDSGLAELSGQAASACLDDAAQLASLQNWAKIVAGLE